MPKNISKEPKNTKGPRHNCLRYRLLLEDLVWLLFMAYQPLDVIQYIRFGLVGFYGASTNFGYLIPNPVHTYMLNIYDLVWLGVMVYQPL